MVLPNLEADDENDFAASAAASRSVRSRRSGMRGRSLSVVDQGLAAGAAQPLTSFGGTAPKASVTVRYRLDEFRHSFDSLSPSLMPCHPRPVIYPEGAKRMSSITQNSFPAAVPLPPPALGVNRFLPVSRS